VTNSTRRTIIASLIVLGAMLVVGSGLVAELTGSFADPDGQFDAIHDTQSSRLRFIAGGTLLLLAALVTVPAIVAIVARTPIAEWRVSHICAVAFAVLFSTLLAGSAAAFATVAASRELGTVFDDTGQFQTGAWVLPQLATALFVGAGAAGSALIVAVSASLRAARGRIRALRISAGVVALLLPLSFAIPPLIGLLPLWLLAAVLASDESRDRHGTPA